MSHASKEVARGNGGLSQRTGDMREAIGIVQAVDDLMECVVTLTREGMGQSQSVLGIARNVESSVAGNVALIDQLSEPATALRDQGDVLRNSIGNFVLS